MFYSVSFIVWLYFFYKCQYFIFPDFTGFRTFHISTRWQDDEYQDKTWSA